MHARTARVHHSVLGAFAMLTNAFRGICILADRHQASDLWPRRAGGGLKQPRMAVELIKVCGGGDAPGRLRVVDGHTSSPE